LAPTGQLIDSFSPNITKPTNAQQRVTNEILNDLHSPPAPMNRLVQGDVGSGKTVVAVIAILAAIPPGYQAALMAPAEVLVTAYRVSWFNSCIYQWNC